VERSNVVLIGMPGAGKSTVGVLLAKRLSLAFLDTDVAIQGRESRTLQEILDSQGADAFRSIEERYVAELACTRTVISTGGSVVYSDTAMHKLRDAGIVVHLDVPFQELARRLTNYATRGLVRRRNQTLEELYRERLPLYRAWAEVAVECGTLDHEQVVERTAAALARQGLFRP
jgi:shikimate kinase